MLDERIEDLANIFLALSDKTRLRLIDLMRNGEVSVGFLADSLGESQPKTSRHLAYMRNAGVVSTRRDGKHVFYAIERQADDACENVMLATLRSLAISNGNMVGIVEPMPDYVSNFETDTAKGDIFPETYMNIPVEEELPVYML